ncbi:MAG: hypothetical protein ACTSPB_00175 [Candidatus Thorarchaeota archaeon]
MVRIYVPKVVCSEMPMVFKGKVSVGFYDANLNPQGAVSVIADDGSDMGLKLDEFFFATEKDRVEWIRIAYPKIPDVIEDGE